MRYIAAHPMQTRNSNTAIFPAFTSCPPCTSSFTFSTSRLQVSASRTLYFTSRNNDSTCEYPYGCFSVTGLYRSGTNTRNGPIITRSAASNKQSVSSEWECVIHAITPSAIINKRLPRKDNRNIFFSIFNLSFFIYLNQILFL